MMPAPAIATGYGGRLTVDLGAIIRNWQALDKVSAGALTGAAVKADGYGVGIVAASKALFAAGARFFFVATPDEGLAVRAALPEAYIFVLNGLHPGAAALYIGERLMPVLNSLPMLEEWMVACLGRNEALPAALHFDTGMNRLGFRLNETSVVKRMCDELLAFMEKHKLWIAEDKARYFDFETLAQNWTSIDEDFRKKVAGFGRCYLISSTGYTSYCYRDVATKLQYARDLHADLALVVTDKTQKHNN